MWNMMLTRFFNTVIKNQRAQIYKHRTLSAFIFNVNNMCTDTFDINLLSSEDKEKILQVINSKSVKDLAQYSITKKRAEKLELHRANNGPFESLDDLLQVRSMNNKCVYNFYKSIICGKKKPPKKIMSGLVVTPQNTDTSQRDVDTVLGIYIGHDLISWSLLNRDCEVLQWSYKSFPRKGPKENIHTLLQETIPIAKKLPKADRYIMQETGGDVGRIQNSHFYQNFVQQSIIGAIILSYLTMLDNKFNDTTGFVANNIFILRRRVLRKIYGLVIDNEGISTQYMVQKLLQESDEPIKTKEPKVLIGTELRNMYNAQSSVCQEQIGWSLLISLAFIELIVHKRPDMILREAPQRL
ncbi:transcription elongation factor, mitochondrial isoform X2 [Temnothorax americanus]|uniref:transcription elongation factor, mitochondrial isoform X2 n=1 Tax=Temnothorax americanus TaxID=1964332 RepID=UPI004068A001